MHSRPIILAALAFFATAAPAIAAEPVTGRWLPADGKAMITIEPCGRFVCGRISRILAPTPKGPPIDERNPDPALRKRPIQGLTVLSGFTPKGKVWNGRIYSPEEGKTYRSVLERTGPNRLRVKGCVLFICQTQVWSRVE